MAKQKGIDTSSVSCPGRVVKTTEGRRWASALFMRGLRLPIKATHHGWGGVATQVLLTGLMALCFAGCVGKEPIRIGFVAQLTGVQAELGVKERNGVQLAVAEINAADRIAGRSIELVIRDDRGTPEGARAADQELIDAGVVAIIGHATSGQTMAGLAVTNPARLVMISPTATTPELSGLDDFFFRVCQSLVDRANALAQHCYQGRGITRLAMIYDTDNAAYSEAFQKAFVEEYKSLGGRLVAQSHFSSKAQPDFNPLVAKLKKGDPDGLLIIAADIDTALIAQRTRLMDWSVPLFTTAWAQTETLIHNGGQAVEGLEIEIANTNSNQMPAYLDFQARYRDRFGENPSFAAVQGYEATMLLAAALKKTGGKAEGLSRALVGIKHFKGLTDTFDIDRYGDAIRTFYLGTIQAGHYVTFKTIIPTRSRH